MTEVCAVQLPGRGSRIGEDFSTSLSSVVSALAETLTSYLDRPFVFFGHSLGALISFELAQELRRVQGVEPAHLFVSACRAPQIAETDRITYNLPDSEFVDEVSRLKGTPKEVLAHPELMQLMIPLLRADFRLCQTYVYSLKPLLSCPITAFGGLEDQDVTRHHLEAWQDQTSSSFSLRMLFGDHFFLHRYESTLLQIISDELRRLVSPPTHTQLA